MSFFKNKPKIQKKIDKNLIIDLKNLDREKANKTYNFILTLLDSDLIGFLIRDYTKSIESYRHKFKDFDRLNQDDTKKIEHYFDNVKLLVKLRKTANEIIEITKKENKRVGLK